MTTELYDRHVGNGEERGKIWSTCWRKDHTGFFGIGTNCPKCEAERKKNRASP